MKNELLNPYGCWYFGVGAEHVLPKLKYKPKQKGDFDCVALIVTFSGQIATKQFEGSESVQILAVTPSDKSDQVLDRSGVFLFTVDTQSFTDFFSVSPTSPQAKRAIGPLFDFLRAGISDPILALPLPLRKDVIFNGVPKSGVYDNPGGVSDPSITIIIDDGVNFAHPRFRMGDGSSRIDYAWVMDAPVVPPINKSAVKFGREWKRTDIETAINEAGNDPEALLREIGYLDYTRNDFHSAAQNISHGTHVADLAAGMDPKTADVNRRIITVSLPSIATEDPSGITLGVFVLNAISYGLERARRILNELGKPNGAVAVNLSYAVSGGPHDGNGLFERIIEELLQYHSSQSGSTNTHVVVPAGNTFLNRTHSQFESDGPVNVEIPWRLRPGDGNSSFLEIWYPVTAKAVEITISSPTGQTWIFPSQCDLPQELNINGVPLGRLSQDIPIQVFPHKRQRIMLALCPTDGTLSGLPVVPHGIWEVSMKIKGSGDKIVDAWIQRDTAPFGYRPLGVQSYFDDPDYERFNDANGDWKEDDNQSPVPHA